MRTLFDSDETPSRRLVLKHTVVLDHRTNDEALRIVQEKMARRLAQTIMESEKFFKTRAYNDTGPTVVEYAADCIILTQDEYADLHRKIFREGVEHARYFDLGGWPPL